MKVWDLPTRVYHWLQAGLFIGLMASAGNGPHVIFGLLLLTLLIWRIVWGFIGSETSRFRQFMASPKRVFDYLRGKEPEKPGHNPAGGYMVITLISALLIQCISGLVLAGWPEVSDATFELFESVHLGMTRVLPALVAIHLAAILVYKLLSKPLLWAMISGKQSKLTGESVAMVSKWRALGVFVASGLVTIAIIVLA